MKTIFLPISKGLLARNILRTGVLKQLAQNNKVIIFLPKIRKIDPPAYIFNEFEGKNVKIEIVENKNLNILEKFVNKFWFNSLVLSKSTEIVSRHNHDKKRRQSYFYWSVKWIIFKPLSCSDSLKRLSRYLYTYFISKNIYAAYFEKYQPDIVFSPSFISHYDIDFLSEAKRRKIKTVGMSKGWDNMDKYLIRVEPDLILAQNEMLAKAAVDYQGFKKEKIKITGFAQFDIYTEKNIYLDKKSYCARKAFNPELPLLFLGSEGMWSLGDQDVFARIIALRDADRIPNCNILIRPHFSTVKRNLYQKLNGYKNIFIDDKFRTSDFFGDNWDPSCEDMQDFANSLYHCDMMVTFASTLALDAACFDKPVIVLAYGGKLNVNGDDAKVIYEQDHYQWVVETGALSMVNNDEELAEAINNYLRHPEFKFFERQQLVKKLCYQVDGRACERITKYILKLANY